MPTINQCLLPAPHGQPVLNKRSSGGPRPLKGPSTRAMGPHREPTASNPEHSLRSHTHCLRLLNSQPPLQNKDTVLRPETVVPRPTPTNLKGQHLGVHPKSLLESGPCSHGLGSKGKQGPRLLLRWTDSSWPGPGSQTWGQTPGTAFQPPAKAWVSNQPSLSFPRPNFSLWGYQSSTEIVSRERNGYKQEWQLISQNASVQP